MIEIRRAVRRAFIVVCAVTFVGLLVSDAYAQGRGRSASARGQVERRKDDADARVPPDAPGLALRADALAAGDYRVDALLSGYKWGLSTVTYSFYEDSVFGGAYYGTEVVSEVSEPVKTNVRAIMAWYSVIMNVNFVEVTETTSNIGLIRVMRSTSPSYAYAYYPASSTMFGLSGDVHLNPSYDRAGDTNGFQNPAGEHGYVSLIHEIGHAVGLKHPHDGTPNLPSAEDNHSHTVMSYGFPGESPGTPMAYDLMALHYLYGARPLRTGNDTYLFSRTAIDQYSVSGQLFIDPSLKVKTTIWDSGGYNVIDLSSITASASGYRLDLNPLGWLTAASDYQTTYLTAGTVIGPGVSIRKVINSGGNDTIYANADANVFSGYASSRVTGTDVLYGADGADSIDLSGYLPAQVSLAASGNDLLIGFGTNGSLRVKDYYIAISPPAIVYEAATPKVSIGDVAIAEGDAGTTNATFSVTLSTPSSSALSVSYAIADGTAQGGSDYVAASGVLTFAAGETQKTITVAINGDAAQESDETFFVMLSAPSAGLEILDGQGNGVILNDDLPPNQPPVAVATASPSTGFAPLTVLFTGSNSYDPDGTIASFAWTFGDGTSSTAANPSHVYAAIGTYTATLMVTDNRGGTNAKTLTIQVQQDPNAIMYVGGIVMQVLSSPAGGSAQATITIRRPDGSAVSGASVTGNWTGLVRGTSSATTNASGVAVLTSKSIKKKGTITVTITSVAKSGLVYDASRNVETSDSVVVP